MCFASVTRHYNKLDGDETCLFHDCDRRVFCLLGDIYTDLQATFQSSRLTGVRLWAVTTLVTVVKDRRTIIMYYVGPEITKLTYHI